MIVSGYHIKENKFNKELTNMEDDYLDDDDVLEEEGYLQPEDEDEESEENGSDSEDLDLDDSTPVDVASYAGKMTKQEIWLSSAYDDIIAAGKNNKDGAIEDAATTVVMANPKHTAVVTVGNIIKELFHKQGHSRMQNSIYTPDTPLRGEDVDIDFLGEDDSGFNKVFAQDAREQIARFIDYLATRDLSKDSLTSRRRKLRHIPAFIIFLFSSGMYDLIINCPTMPKVYQHQIDLALEKIMEAKYDIVEELAKKYEECGRKEVADRVRKMQISWFYKEPAEIRTASEYSDLNLTYDDVVIYREYRSRFTNISRAITQDVISDFVETCVDEEKGIFEKLKDKTRSDAIADVKQLYKDWSKENPLDSDLAKKIIWKDVDELKS